MPLKGSSNMLISPCYDGCTIPGVQHIAGDGLSLISIRESHRNCKFTTNPNSNQPLISCAQGMKARNSYFSLHKPDLRKVKGLECATAKSITELLQAHNVENAGKQTYKKKMLRLLGSLAPKKSKAQPQFKLQALNRGMPANVCVLSSVCQEKEITLTGTKASQGKCSSSLDFTENDNSNKKDSEYKKISVTNEINTFNMNGDQTSIKDYFLASPSILNTPENSSDNALIEYENVETSKTNSLPTDIDDNLSILNIKSCLDLKDAREDLTSNQTELASCKLECNNSSLPHISIVSQKCACTEYIYTKRSEESTKCKHNTNSSITDLVNIQLKSSIEGQKIDQNHIKNNILEESLVNTTNIENNKTFVNDDEVQCLDQTSLENPSEVVDSIFTEIFKEMGEIEKYISSYMSSFYMCEEEYENYSVLNKNSSEIMSHFFEQLHCPKKVINSQCKNSNCTMTSNDNVVLQEANKPKNELTLFNENSMTESPEKKGNSNILIDKRPSLHCTHKSKNISNSVLTESVKMSQNIIDESNYLKNNSCSRENFIGYCIWGENDAASDLCSKEDITINHSSNILTPENQIPLITNHKALIPITFFENIWKEFIESVNLVNDVQTFNSYSVDGPFPSYGHWMKMYDQNILEEAENVLDSIDNFVTSGCFPLQENVSCNSAPSSITEFDHFDQHSPIKEIYNCVSQTVFISSSEENTDRWEGKYKSCNQMLSYPEKCIEQMNKQSLCPDSNDIETEKSISTIYQSRGIVLKNHLTGNRCTKIKGKNGKYNGTVVNEYKPSIALEKEKLNKISPSPAKGLDNADKNTIKKILNNSESFCTDTTNSVVRTKTESKEIKAELKSQSNLATNGNSIGKMSQILKKNNLDNIVNFKNIKVKKSVITINKSRNNYLHETTDSKQTDEHHLSFRQPNNESIFGEIEHDDVTQTDENTYNLPEQSLHEEEILKSRNVLEAKSKVLSGTEVVTQNLTNIVLQNKTSWSKTCENESNNCKPRLDQSSQNPENNYHPPSTQFLFSSPNVQLNLTNPIMNVTKK